MALAERYMTAKQVADYLGMSLCWLYREMKHGQTPAFRRRGRKYLFLTVDVKRWDEEHTSKARVNGSASPTSPRRTNQPSSVHRSVA